MQDFRKLTVWRNSVTVACAIYEATSQLPPSERFGLTAQLRSAAVSISSNIAEGFGRPGRGDVARFLGIAIGSACEVESQLHLTARLGLLSSDVNERLLEDIDSLKRQMIRLTTRSECGELHPS